METLPHQLIEIRRCWTPEGEEAPKRGIEKTQHREEQQGEHVLSLHKSSGTLCAVWVIASAPRRRTAPQIIDLCLWICFHPSLHPITIHHRGLLREENVAKSFSTNREGLGLVAGMLTPRNAAPRS